MPASLTLTAWKFKMSPTIKVVGYALLCKLILIIILVGSWHFVPLYDYEAQVQVPAPPLETHELITSLTTWDGKFYLHLSNIGYTRGDPCCAFYPFLPLTIRAIAGFLHCSHVVAGLLLTNLCSILALGLLHHYVSLRHGLKIANSSVLLILAFPSAIFFSLIYTESVFLLVVLLFFYGVYRKKYWLIILTSVLLPTIRAIGLFTVLPLCWFVFQVARDENRLTAIPKTSAARNLLNCMLRPEWFLPLVPIVGFAAYLLTMYIYTGNPLEGFVAQQHYPNQPSVKNILNLPGFSNAFITPENLHSMTGSLIDRILFVVFLMSLPAIWRLDIIYFWYAIGSGLIPALSNWFFSYNRFILLCFPVFIVLGKALCEEERKWLRFYYLGLCGALQTWFWLRHTHSFWAG